MGSPRHACYWAGEAVCSITGSEVETATRGRDPVGGQLNRSTEEVGREDVAAMGGWVAAMVEVEPRLCGT